MTVNTGTPVSVIVKALIILRPDEPNSFLTLEIGGKRYDAIQAVKNRNGKYHVEILRKDGKYKAFNGNSIFAKDDIGEDEALELFMAMLVKRDRMQMPAGFKEISATAAKYYQH